MTIYRRYFKVTSGPIVEAVGQVEAGREKARAAIKELEAELNVGDMMFYNDGRFAGFDLNDDAETKMFKRTEHGYYLPKLNYKKGKEIDAKIKALPRLSNQNEALAAVGLAGSYLVCMNRGMMYKPQLAGRPQLGVWVVSVPWRDVSEKELDEYRNRNNGFNSNMDHLLWEPHESMKEIKEWEALKIIDEMNERLKEMKND